MRDAMGGTVVITIIVFFIVVVSAYLAFNVNYTKAFRMKNKIISVYEEYRGDCDNIGTNCATKIREYAKEIGYKPAELTCSNGYSKRDNLYCVKPMQVVKDASSDVYKDDSKVAYYYKIETKIDINIPIVDNVLGIRVFRITGDTKIFEFTS